MSGRRVLPVVAAGVKRRSSDGRNRRLDIMELRAPELLARLFIFDDFEDNLTIGPRGYRVEDRADRFSGTPLLADHPPQVFLRHPQLKHRGSIALGLLDFDRVRIVDQLLRQELYELLHGWLLDSEVVVRRCWVF